MKEFSLLFNVKGEQYFYLLTPLDRLNLIRAVAREGKPYNAVAWSLIQRFAWLYPQGNFTNFTDFVKAYAQPINPRWFPNGDKHLGYIRYLKSKYSGAELAKSIEKANEKAENRIEYANADLDEITEKYIAIVDSVLGGNTPNPVPGAVHYIASTGGNNEQAAKTAQQEFANKRVDLSKPIYYGPSTAGNNWFFSVPGSQNLVVEISSELAPTNLVNIGTHDSPIMAVVYFLYGAAAKALADKIKNG